MISTRSVHLSPCHPCLAHGSSPQWSSPMPAALSLLSLPPGTFLSAVPLHATADLTVFQPAVPCDTLTREAH